LQDLAVSLVCRVVREREVLPVQMGAVVQRASQDSRVVEARTASEVAQAIRAHKDELEVPDLMV